MNVEMVTMGRRTAYLDGSSADYLREEAENEMENCFENGTSTRIEMSPLAMNFVLLWPSEKQFFSNKAQGGTVHCVQRPKFVESAHMR